MSIATVAPSPAGITTWSWPASGMIVCAGLSHADFPGKKTFTATAGSGGIQRVEVSDGDFFFEPKHIIVQVNVPVE